MKEFLFALAKLTLEEWENLKLFPVDFAVGSIYGEKVLWSLRRLTMIFPYVK